MGSSGPEHEKHFEVRLTLPDATVFTAIGPSVKRAEQMAAGLALKDLESRSEG
jgi:ribonuclease-3